MKAERLSPVDFQLNLIKRAFINVQAEQHKCPQ